ncbi:putative peptidoglycan D,D-transpeptidase FtsI [Candidatus Phycosocius bacilliformis]|uniref:Beta-lactamase n=1 Tax=Candidatus Phycosocius bacilliformis TaxID=1445552 RepID=A0A2P2EC89_9PROT|nr:penicillin-binding protein 2 [Candidatus Phycosocius bacilliformis]GBF58675.1 putative peptidoglycan D,D-transpeptidase FtsI [Candidatus Phycosocius bacilliformis]
MTDLRQPEATVEWPRPTPRDQGGVGTMKGRTIALAVAFIAGFGLLSLRAIQIGLFRPVDEAATAARAAAAPPSKRADLVDRNGQLLATSLVAHSLYADPKRIWDPVETAKALRTVFPEMDEASLIEKLSSRSRFVWIKRRLTPKQKQAVWELAQPGLEFIEEAERIYPLGHLAGHVIGSMHPDGSGINGIERALNDRLTTGAGTEPVRLSLDMRVQYLVETELAQAATAFRAEGGAAIMLDAKTGEVIASASWPFMDPNRPEANTPNQQNNRVTNSRFEMGSTFKVFTVAIGLEDRVITPESVFDARAPMRIGRELISDFHAMNKIVSVSEILAHSSNIGTVRIARSVGAPRVREFFSRLGLMEAAGGELLENARPILPKRWSEITAATASFGHGIAVSPMAVAGAYAAVSNGGHYIRPTFIARDPTVPVASRNVISPATSTTLVKLMRDVVTNGTGKNADAEGYEVAGKTGTAEKAGPNGYDSNRRVSSFAGVFPARDPRYVVVFLLDEPKGYAQSGGVATAAYAAAPSVSRIISRSAPLLGIAPTRTLAQMDAPTGRADPGASSPSSRPSQKAAQGEP